MVIDSSALLAILQDEPERRRFNEAIEAAAERLLSVATFVEVSIVIDARYGPPGLHHVDLFLDRADIELVDVDAEQARIARDAYSRFGKGRHPAAAHAGLNFGDCFSYALANTRGLPLLFKGEDFARTDLVAAI